MSRCCPVCSGSVSGVDTRCASCGWSDQDTRKPVPGRVAEGTVTNVVTGPRQPAITGHRLWLPAAGAGVALVVMIGVTALAGPSLLVGDLVTLLALTAFQLLIGLAVSLAGRRSRPAGDRPNGPFRTLFRPLVYLRGASNMLPFVDARRFRVVDVSGSELTCDMLGVPFPAEPREGDIVQVYGRRSAGGLVSVRQLVSVGNASTTTGRIGMAARVTRLAYVASPASSVLAAAAVCWLATR